MSVLVHGEEKRESVVRELHGVGLEHREARAVRHDDVVGAPSAGALGVAERDRVAQRRVGVAVAVRRPHAAAARPRSRHGRRRRVADIAATLATRGRTRSAPSSRRLPPLKWVTGGPRCESGRRAGLARALFLCLECRLLFVLFLPRRREIKWRGGPCAPRPINPNRTLVLYVCGFVLGRLRAAFGAPNVLARAALSPVIESWLG